VTLDVPTLAYVAGVLDTQANIKTRRTSEGTELPMLAMYGPNVPLLEYLASLTDTTMVVTRRSYAKAGCAEHCKEKHQHIQSLSGRWTLTGMKACVVLYNIRPYMRLQTEAVTAALNVGLDAPFKPATLTNMSALCWAMPALEREGATT
jgi:hypothetical protein